MLRRVREPPRLERRALACRLRRQAGSRSLALGLRAQVGDAQRDLCLDRIVALGERRIARGKRLGAFGAQPVTLPLKLLEHRRSLCFGRRAALSTGRARLAGSALTAGDRGRRRGRRRKRHGHIGRDGELRVEQSGRVGRAGKGRAPDLTLLGDPWLVVEHGQDALLTPVGHGGEGRAHEAPPADSGPPTAYFDAGIVRQLEALYLEAGRCERRHVPPSPRRITDLTARCVRENTHRMGRCSWTRLPTA